MFNCDFRHEFIAAKKSQFHEKRVNKCHLTIPRDMHKMGMTELGTRLGPISVRIYIQDICSNPSMDKLLHSFFYKVWDMKLLLKPLKFGNG